MKLLKFLGKIEQRPTKKQFIIFFIILLIPNLLRQAIYTIAGHITGQTGFIVSPETVAIYVQGMPLIGVLQETILGLFYAYFWFRFRRLKFLSYAWINDALFDFLSVIVWFFTGNTVLQWLGFGYKMELLFRELILFYLIVGPLMYKYKLNIKRLSLVYSIIGILFILIIVMKTFL